MGYVSDLKNKDVRTEGMSYGMMAAVQIRPEGYIRPSVEMDASLHAS